MLTAWLTIAMGTVSFLGAFLAMKLILSVNDNRKQEVFGINPKARFLTAGLMSLLFGGLTAASLFVLSQLGPLSDFVVFASLAVACAVFVGTWTGLIVGGQTKGPPKS